MIIVDLFSIDTINAHFYYVRYQNNNSMSGIIYLFVFKGKLVSLKVSHTSYIFF